LARSEAGAQFLTLTVDQADVGLSGSYPRLRLLNPSRKRSGITCRAISGGSGNGSITLKLFGPQPSHIALAAGFLQCAARLADIGKFDALLCRYSHSAEKGCSQGQEED
jgi:hypothetical protein